MWITSYYVVVAGQTVTSQSTLCSGAPDTNAQVVNPLTITFLSQPFLLLFDRQRMRSKFITRRCGEGVAPPPFMFHITYPFSGDVCLTPTGACPSAIHLACSPPFSPHPFST